MTSRTRKKRPVKPKSANCKQTQQTLQIQNIMPNEMWDEISREFLAWQTDISHLRILSQED